MPLNAHKLDDLILYLGSSPHVENLGITKLWKLIYFIDVAFLRETGKSLTDSEYIKYDHGPVPSRGDKRLKHLGKEDPMPELWPEDRELPFGTEPRRARLDPRGEVAETLPVPHVLRQQGG